MYHDYKQTDLTWYNHKPVRHDYFITHFAWILKQGVHYPKLVDFLLNLFCWEADKNKKEFCTINWRQIFSVHCRLTMMKLHYNDAEGPSLLNGTIGYFYIATTKFLTGRFHVPVHLFSDRSQMTSKYDKTCSATLGHCLVSFSVLFYIIEKQKWLLMTSSVRLLCNRS